MSRFYFHVHDDIDALDVEGVECADAKTAVACAERFARGLAADEVSQGRLHLDHRLVVADERGEVIATVKFRDCVKIDG